MSTPIAPTSSAPTSSAPTSSAPTSSAAAGSASSTALSAISSNFNDFLTLLTTQLQNQDPSSPMDTSQFTSELAQFAGVQQQVNTNTNLGTLIQLTQGDSLLQGSALIGKQVALNSTALPLQNGAAQLQFTSPSAQPVVVSVMNAGGQVVASDTVNASIGSNHWSWNGHSPAGVAEPDGAYTASVASVGAAGATQPLAFTTDGTVTGVINSGGTVDLQLGATTVALGSVASL